MVMHELGTTDMVHVVVVPMRDVAMEILDILELLYIQGAPYIVDVMPDLDISVSLDDERGSEDATINIGAIIYSNEQVINYIVSGGFGVDSGVDMVSNLIGNIRRRSVNGDVLPVVTIGVAIFKVDADWDHCILEENHNYFLGMFEFCIISFEVNSIVYER